MTNLVNEIIREDLATITSSSESDLTKIVNSHVVLTGASGFIGTWLMLSFLHARKQLNGEGLLVLSCRNSAPMREILRQAGFNHGYEIVEADIREFPDEIIKDKSLVIHAATPARASLNNSNPLEMFDIIVAGQRHLLDLCANKESVRFLFLSSGAVYGKQPLDLVGFPETWNGAPLISDTGNAYHEGKRVAELMGNLYSVNSTFEFISARLFAFLAPFLPLNEHFAAGNFIRDALAGEDIVIRSGGGSVRSYQYATDLCEDLWSLLIRGKSGNAYNIGSDSEVTVLELAETIVRLTDSSLRIKIEGFDSIENVSRYVPNIERVKKNLSRIEQTTLEQSIIRTMRWVQLGEHP